MKKVKNRMNRLEARQELERLVSEGQSRPDVLPCAVHLSAILKAPELFQFRTPSDVESRQHIHEMSRSVNDRKTLDAILVWWGGQGWYCIDGHHRLEAYAMGNWDENIPVPVSIYKGSPVQAMLRALRCNAPGRLIMSKQQKVQAAWELVATTTAKEASADAISRASTVSERYIFAMRKVKKMLLERDPLRDLTSMSWPKARAEAAGGDAILEEIDWDAQTYEEAKKVADTLRQIHGNRVSADRPEVIAMALEICDRRLPDILKDYWRTHGVTLPEQEEEEEEF